MWGSQQNRFQVPLKWSQVHIDQRKHKGIVAASGINNIYAIKYPAKAIVYVSEEASRSSPQELLTFYQASTLNTKKYKTEFLFLINHKAIKV